MKGKVKKKGKWIESVQWTIFAQEEIMAHYPANGNRAYVYNEEAAGRRWITWTLPGAVAPCSNGSFLFTSITSIFCQVIF